VQKRPIILSMLLTKATPYVCIHVYVFSVYTCKCMYMNASMCVYMHICTVRIHAHLCKLMFVCMYMHMYVHECTYACIHTHVCTLMHVRVYTCTNTHAYVFNAYQCMSNILHI